MKPNHIVESFITKEMLEEILAYDPDTGLFTLTKTRGGIKAGSIAGYRRRDGYVQIKLYGRAFLAHRLAWFWVHGKWPTIDVDHIDRDKDNNRILNLRLATRIQNTANSSLKSNNKSGHSGVFYLVRKDGRSPRWLAHIRLDGKMKKIGFFKTKVEAIAAREAEAKRIHGKFASLK